MCVIFRYSSSHKLEEIGQAVFNAFVGQWFLFGIQATARNLLHRTSTPYRFQPLSEPLPDSHDRFTVWQMILPSTSDLSFKTVMNHLTARNGMSVSSSSELSLNMSTSASVGENSAEHVREDLVSKMHLNLSCDDTASSMQQSVEWSFIVPSPLPATCDVKCSTDGNLLSAVYVTHMTIVLLVTSRNACSANLST